MTQLSSVCPAACNWVRIVPKTCNALLCQLPFRLILALHVSVIGTTQDDGWSRQCSKKKSWMNEHYSQGEFYNHLHAVAMSDEKVWKRWCRTFHWLRGTPKRTRCSLCPGFHSKVWKKSQLIQHERSKVHSTSAGRCCCPDAEAFRQMFHERSNGTSLRQSKHGLSKSVKLMWVSNEAIKEIVKTRVQRCLTASLSQDAQGSSLGVRMTVVSFAKGHELRESCDAVWWCLGKSWWHHWLNIWVHFLGHLLLALFPKARNDSSLPILPWRFWRAS